MLKSTSLFASLTLSDRSIVALTSVATKAVSKVATGNAPATRISMFAKLDSLPIESSTLNKILAVPSKVSSGLKLMAPDEFTLHKPSLVLIVSWLPTVEGFKSILDKS